MGKKKKLTAPSIQIGRHTVSANTGSALTAYLAKKADKRDETLLNELIYSMALDNVPWPHIADRVGLPWQECKRIFDEMMAKWHDYTPIQMRQMLTAQVQRIINYMQEGASQGSDKHAQVMLQGIERLAKMHELEISKTKIEVELITNHQSELLIRIVGMMLEHLMERSEIRNALQPQVIDVVVAEVLELAGSEIRKAEATMIAPDTKIEGGVLSATS